MGILGPEISAAVFDDVKDAEEGWAMLNDADIPSAVITDPGMLGAYGVQLMVNREDLDRAQAVLAPLVKRLR